MWSRLCHLSVTSYSIHNYPARISGFASGADGAVSRQPGSLCGVMKRQESPVQLRGVGWW